MFVSYRHKHIHLNTYKSMYTGSTVLETGMAFYVLGHRGEHTLQAAPWLGSDSSPVLQLADSLKEEAQGLHLLLSCPVSQCPVRKGWFGGRGGGVICGRSPGCCPSWGGWCRCPCLRRGGGGSAGPGGWSGRKPRRPELTAAWHPGRPS